MGYTTANGGKECANGQANGIHKNRVRLIREGKVYDVTEFASRHPGGREVLEKHIGEDIGELMTSTDSHVHSKAAYTILEKYYIGTVEQLREQNGNFKEGHEYYSRPMDYYKNDIVDWDQPLLGQVEYLGDKYFEWTHQQVDRPVRLFKSEYAEMMTKAPWWFVPLTWVPVTLYMMWSSFKSLSAVPETWPQNALGCEFGPMSLPVLMLGGFLIWTLLEYVIHRWIFHLQPPSNWPFLIRLHFSLHGQHHKSPMDPLRLVFPPLPASVFALAFYVMCCALFPLGMAQGVFAGLVSGYMGYDLTHYYIHHGQPLFAYFQRLKKYHTHHHYEHQQLGFGISSKMWDYPFGTLIPEDQVYKKKS